MNGGNQAPDLHTFIQASGYYIVNNHGTRGGIWSSLYRSKLPISLRSDRGDIVEVFPEDEALHATVDLVEEGNWGLAGVSFGKWKLSQISSITLETQGDPVRIILWLDRNGSGDVFEWESVDETKERIAGPAGDDPIALSDPIDDGSVRIHADSTDFFEPGRGEARTIADLTGELGPDTAVHVNVVTQGTSSRDARIQSFSVVDTSGDPVTPMNTEKQLDPPGNEAATRTPPVGEPPDQGRQRGFFENDGDGPEPLQNVLNLTILGFVLSVAGIVHQMVRGR